MLTYISFWMQDQFGKMSVWILSSLKSNTSNIQITVRYSEKQEKKPMPEKELLMISKQECLPSGKPLLVVVGLHVLFLSRCN